MKIHTVEQGTEEWLALRTGLVTTSNFDKIITPGGKPSKQSTDYMLKLVGEMASNSKDIHFQTKAMEWGNFYEEHAANTYAAITGRHVQTVGFVTDDDLRIGCSPDRLVDLDGLIEIKCPQLTQFTQTAISGHVDTKYYPQIQGQLWITKRHWCDFVSYHPHINMPTITRVERDEDYIAVMKELVYALLEEMDRQVAFLEKERGWQFKKTFKRIYHEAA